MRYLICIYDIIQCVCVCVRVHIIHMYSQIERVYFYYCIFSLLIQSIHTLSLSFFLSHSAAFPHIAISDSGQFRDKVYLCATEHKPIGKGQGWKSKKKEEKKTINNNNNALQFTNTSIYIICVVYTLYALYFHIQCFVLVATDLWTQDERNKRYSSHRHKNNNHTKL